jgi:uncharacterized protein
MPLTVGVSNDPEAGVFRASVDGRAAGIVAYRQDGDVYDLLHTEVDDAFEGQGVGSELVHQVLGEIRAAGARVRPSCPFVRRYVQRHPDEADVVS